MLLQEEADRGLHVRCGPQVAALEFPGAEPLSVAAIMKKAGVDESRAPEILDIVGRLEDLGVVEARLATREGSPA